MAQLLSAVSLGNGYSQMAFGAIQTAEGDYLLAGRSFGEASISAGIAARVSPSGMIFWENTYDAEYSTLFSSAAQLANGTFVAAGSYFYSDTSGDEDIWLVNIDAQGNKIKEITFGKKNHQNDGLAIAATADGGFVVAGLDLPKGGDWPNAWVLKFDPNLKLLWKKQFDGVTAIAVIQTSDGGYALSGARGIEGSLNSHVYALRLDDAGETIWEKTYEDFEVYVLLRSGIAETGEGGFAIVAKSVVMKVDGQGNVIHAAQNGQLNLGSVACLPDGTYAIGGSLIVNDFDHAYVAVLDRTEREILWDNTEILYNSELTQVLVNSDGFVAGGGYGPAGADKSLMMLAIFNQAEDITPT